MYRKNSSESFWTVSGACLLRRQKYQNETMKAMSAIVPPTVPPTMAPKLGVVEGAVLVGELVELEVGGVEVGVTVSTDIVGVSVAKALEPNNIGEEPICAVVVTALAAELYELYTP